MNAMVGRPGPSDHGARGGGSVKRETRTPVGMTRGSTPRHSRTDRRVGRETAMEAATGRSTCWVSGSTWRRECPGLKALWWVATIGRRSRTTSAAVRERLGAMGSWRCTRSGATSRTQSPTARRAPRPVVTCEADQA